MRAVAREGAEALPHGVTVRVAPNRALHEGPGVHPPGIFPLRWGIIKPLVVKLVER